MTFNPKKPGSGALRRLSLILALVASAAPGHAQEAPATPPKTPPMAIHRASAPIEVDGDLGDAGWKDALWFDDFYETSPADNLPAKVKTTVWLSYDARYFYIGIKADDLLGHPQWIVPRQDESARGQPDALGLRSCPCEKLRIVRTRRVVREVVLDRPDLVETQLFGQLAGTQLDIGNKLGLGGIRLIGDDTQRSRLRRAAPLTLEVDGGRAGVDR